MSCEIVEQRTGQRPNIKVLPPRELTEEERESQQAFRRNKDFFLEQRERILDEHPGQYIIIFGESEVRGYDTHSEMLAFKESLDDRKQKSAYLPHIIWRNQHVYPTGYLRVIRA